MKKIILITITVVLLAACSARNKQGCDSCPYMKAKKACSGGCSESCARMKEYEHKCDKCKDNACKCGGTLKHNASDGGSCSKI